MYVLCFLILNYIFTYFYILNVVASYFSSDWIPYLEPSKVMGESGKHTNGVAIHMISSVADVFRLVSLKLLVSMPDLDPITALSVYSRVGSVLLLPSIIFLEINTHSHVWDSFYNHSTLILLNSLMAVSLNVSAIVFAKKATPTVVAMTVCFGTMALMYN